SCTGPVDEDAERSEDYAPLFERAIARGIDMVCANPDLVVQKGDKLIICGGALARRVELAGGGGGGWGQPPRPVDGLGVAGAAGRRRRAGCWRSATGRIPTFWERSGRASTRCSWRMGSTAPTCWTEGRCALRAWTRCSGRRGGRRPGRWRRWRGETFPASASY